MSNPYISIPTTPPAFADIRDWVYPRTKCGYKVVGYTPKGYSRAVNQLFHALPLEFKVIGYRGSSYGDKFIPEMTPGSESRAPQFIRVQSGITLYEIWVMRSVRAMLQRNQPNGSRPLGNSAYRQLTYQQLAEHLLIQDGAQLNYQQFEKYYSAFADQLITEGLAQIQPSMAYAYPELCA